MNKKIKLVILAIMILLVVTGCGQKSKEDIVAKLEKQIEQMGSYEVDAQMSLQMGADKQTYDINIRHKQPNFYRVHLKNDDKKQSQMIIKNNNDVFVVTPALNKSFRFNSEWPKNSSQVYLYESLVKDIVSDTEATFTETKEHYIFETKTTYPNNKMLPIQEIHFTKKSLHPVSVKIMDTDRNELVTVNFANFKLNVELKEEDFDLKKNMTSARLKLEDSVEVSSENLIVKYPTAEIPGVTLVEEQEIATEDGKRIILTYDGAGKSFTFIQERAKVVTAVADVATSTYIKGEPVDLKTTIGALTDNSIMWTDGGVDYFIVSNELSQEELVMVADSVYNGTVIK